MKNLHVAVLATLFGISATAGMLASTTTIASADQGDHGNGHHRNNNRNWQNGQCNINGNTHRGDNNENTNEDSNQNNNDDENENENDNDNDDQGEQGDNGNGQYSGTNGQYGQYNCYPNGTNGQGSSMLRGTITSVNGNRVTLMAGFGNFVTINDQPALNNQQTGRVVVGRYVTAHGYYQNGIFYATSLQ